MKLRDRKAFITGASRDIGRAIALAFAQEGAAVLLLEDGVYAAMQGTTAEETVKGASNRLKLYALGPDLKARGLAEDSVIEGIEVVDYDGFVDLAASNERIQPWL